MNEDLLPLSQVSALVGCASGSLVSCVILGVEVIDWFLKIFFGFDPLDLVLQGLSDVLGLGGRQREVATELSGLRLMASGNLRVRQLGIGIYSSAKLYGRIISAQKDIQRWFVPAVQQTDNYLALNSVLQNGLDFIVWRADTDKPTQAWDRTFRVFHQGRINDCRDDPTQPGCPPQGACSCR